MTLHINKGILLILFSCFTVSLFSQKVDKSNHSLLWEITGKDLAAPSYLFGTMHVKNPKAFELPDSVYIAIENCEAFANEVQPDSMTFYYWDLYAEGDTTNFLKKILGEEAYDALNRRSNSELGKPIDSLEMKKPMILKSLLDNRNEKLDSLSHSKDLDFYLFDLAYLQNKSLLGLELPADRKRLADATFKSFDKSFQENIKIQDTIEFDLSFLNILTDKMKTVFQIDPMQEMLDTYRTGDLEKIKKWYDKGPKDKEYQYEILNRRNKVMVENLLKIGREKSLFSAVGVAHLIGEENMLNLLRLKGYNVRRVSPIFTDFGENYKVKKEEREWTGLHNEILSEYKISFPGIPYKEKSSEVTNKLLLDSYRYLNPYTEFVHRSAVRFYPYIGTEYTKEQIYRETIDSYLARGTYNKEESYKDIMQGDVEGKEFVLVSDSTGQASYNRIFLVGNYLYYFEVNINDKDDDKTDIYRFFNSIEIENAIPKGWETLSDKRSAFSVYCPAGAQDRTIKTPVPLEDGTMVEYTLTMWLSTDLEKGDSYLIRTNDFPKGVVMEDDSLFFASTLDVIKTSMQAEVKEFEEITYKGLKGFDAIFFVQGVYAKVRAVLRGGRTYLLLQQRPIGIDKAEFNDKFFNSLEILPYEDTEYIPYEYEEENFIVNFPSEAEIKKDTFSRWQFPFLYTTRYNSIDNNTGAICYLDINEFSEYYEMESIDSFNNEVLAVDTTLSYINQTRNPMTINKIEGIYANEKSERTSTDYYTWFGFVQNKMYQLHYYAPDKENEEEKVMNFFKSFQLLEENREISLLNSKRDKIFDALINGDSLTLEAARLGFDNYEFDEEDKPAIYSMLRDRLTPDTLNFPRTFSELIDVLSTLDPDEETEKLVRDLLPSIAGDTKRELELLSLLVKTPNSASLQFFFEKAKELSYDEDEYYYPYQAFAPFQDSILLAQEYFSELVDLSKNKIFTDQFYYICSRMVSQDTVNFDFVSQQSSLFLTNAEEILRNEKILESDTIVTFDEQDQLYTLLNILSHIKNDAKVSQLFNRIYEIKDSAILYYALVSRFKNGEKVNKKKIDILKTSVYEYSYLLYKLESDEMLDVLPKKDLKPRVLSETLVKQAVYEDFYSDDFELEYIGQYQRTIEDKEHDIYLYSYKFDDSEGYVCATQLKNEAPTVQKSIERLTYETKSYDSPEDVLKYWFD
jgi:uncharacterized protein YbaP (TraB family)